MTGDLLTILVCGVSGVGKTHLINRTLSHIPHAVALRASEIIGSVRQNDDAEALRRLPRDELERSQEMLVQGFRQYRETHPEVLVILDAHSVIDRGETEPVLFDIPVHVIARLVPSGIIFIEDSAEHIAKRRLSDRSRARPPRSPEQLGTYQTRSLAVCESYQRALGVPLVRVRSGDEFAFIRAVGAIVGTHKTGRASGANRIDRATGASDERNSDAS